MFTYLSMCDMCTETTNELHCEKRYLLTCAPIEDLNQSEHPCSLIRVFAVYMKKFVSLAIQNVPSEDSDQTAQMSYPKVCFLMLWLK